MKGLPNESWTISRLLDWTKEHFVRAGLDAPRLCAEMLLSHVLDMQRIELYTHFSDEPLPEQLDAFRDLVSRAAKNEPVAYLVGSREFYSVKIEVSRDVLVPRPETELLVAEAIEYLRSLALGGRMWDVCTGSGCVAVAVASQVDNVGILASDISEPAVRIAEKNACTHKLSTRISCIQADLLNRTTGVSPVNASTIGEDKDELFDVITANPPYVPDGEQLPPNVLHEPANALRAGQDGMDIIRKLIPQVAKRLKPGGMFAMEFSQEQTDEVKELILATGEMQNVRIVKDQNGHDRLAAAIKKDD